MAYFSISFFAPIFCSRYFVYVESYTALKLVILNWLFWKFLVIYLAAFCGLPPETGDCRALFDKWYYDAKQRKCLMFQYGGCGGNLNNFDSAESCQRFCGGYSGILSLFYRKRHGYLNSDLLLHSETTTVYIVGIAWYAYDFSTLGLNQWYIALH